MTIHPHLKAASYYAHTLFEDNISFIVYPVKHLCTKDNNVFIEKGTRRESLHRLDYNRNNLCIDHFNPYWYTRRVYNNLFPQFAYFVETNDVPEIYQQQ